MTSETIKTLYVSDFEIEEHGADYADYWQGAGVSCTRFSDIVTGIGDNHSEAFEDALEQLAMSGVKFDFIEWDTNFNDAWDNVGAYAERNKLDVDGELPEYRVSIRYNASEFYKLPDCVPVWLIYASLFAPYLGVYSNFAEHLAENDYMRADDFTPYQTHRTDSGKLDGVKIEENLWLDVSRWIGYGDYFGDTITENNFHYFAKTYKALKGKAWVEVCADYDYHAVYINLLWLMQNTEHAITDDVNSVITSYSSLDDDSLSELEARKSDEAFESWALYDFKRAIEQAYADADNEGETDTVSECETFLTERAKLRIIGDAFKGYTWASLRQGETYAEQLERVTRNEWREVFEACREQANAEWSSEAVNMRIDVDRVAEKFDADTLLNSATI